MTKYRLREGVKLTERTHVHTKPLHFKLLIGFYLILSYLMFILFIVIVLCIYLLTTQISPLWDQ